MDRWSGWFRFGDKSLWVSLKVNDVFNVSETNHWHCSELPWLFQEHGFILSLRQSRRTTLLQWATDADLCFVICVCICFLCLRDFGFWPCRIEWLRRGSAPSAMFRVHLRQAGLIAAAAAADASFLYHLGWGEPSAGCSVFLGLRSMCVCVLKTNWCASQKCTQLDSFCFWSEHVFVLLESE